MLQGTTKAKFKDFYEHVQRPLQETSIMKPIKQSTKTIKSQRDFISTVPANA